MDQAPTPAPPADRPTRRPLLWIGAALWTAVFIALIAAFLLRGDRSEQVEQGEELIAVEGGEAGSQLLPGGVAPKAEPMFDPEGLPPFSLTERRGETVTNDTLEGSPYIVGFIFTRCPTVCPKVSEAMTKLRKPLDGTGVKLVTLTVDPDYDTTEILTNYADFYDPTDSPDWLWLTGPQAEIYGLIRDGFKQVVYETTGEDRKPGFEVFHTSNLMLVGPDGVVLGKYNSQVPAEMAKLRQDAVKLAKSSDGDDEANG
ncbi:SCO family protein [Alienimonas chondri]|uniref:Thioredoxin domain-containing protein n=1 Tax=Alienimonas chondri TaxID=2681879 RepID=A0ABX1VDK7_9PLAN|nr:SCO family protein [Alienimonas chondri]NNJ26184.1 hypothetical protein [Alienimonas chondri]